MQILIAEDERLACNTVAAYLREKGHAVDTAFDGLEALRLVKENSPDVVLTDLRMPGMDGMTLLKEVKTLDESIEVIIISGFGDIGLVIEAQRSGAFDFIRKPIDFRELEMALERTGKFRRVSRARQLAERRIDLMEKKSSLTALETITGGSAPIKRLKSLISKVAQTDRTTVLICGETGTGKELVAQAIHRLSLRAANPFIPISCTCLTHGLAESELFGHEPGAFTGARGRKAGFFELADGGTLFLDEIGDMELSLQSQLLRVLEQFSFFRVGGKKEISVNVRVIAATNRDLREMSREGTFRIDLLHRLEVFVIQTPPLRSISSDIETLCRSFSEKFSRELGKDIKGLEPQALAVLKRYNFPGNVRELRNMIERAIILSSGPFLILEDFPNLQTRQPTPPADQVPASSGLDLAEMEKRLISSALRQATGVKLRAAELLGISRESLRRRMEKYGFEP